MADDSTALLAGQEDAAVAHARQFVPGLDETAMRVGINLVRASNVLTQVAESSVHRKLGLSWPGFRILFIIWTYGELEARRITRIAGVTRQTVSSVLSNLERDGFISRTRSQGKDRRLISVRLSDLGFARVEEAISQHNALESALFACLDQDEQAVLSGLLVRVVAANSASTG